MTQSARLFVSIAMVLVLPSVAGAVNTEFRALDGAKAVPNAKFTFEGAGETKTATTDAGGKAVVDLQPNTEYLISQAGMRGFWPSAYRLKTPATANEPITFQAKPVQPTDLWSPPPGIVTFSFLYQGLSVDDMKQQKDRRTDTPTDPNNGPFINWADAAQLRDRNNDLTNGFNVDMTGLYVAVGLPVGPLGRCECMNFSHALGAGGGYNYASLDVRSRSNQQAFATELAGGGAFYTFDYTLTAMARPSDKWYSRLGSRLNFAYMSGNADVDRHPKGSDGLSSFNAQPTSEPSGDMNWRNWSIGLDFIYRICDCFAIFAGVKYRETFVTVNTKDPTFVPGLGEVNRAIDQRYFNANLIPRFGVDAIIAQPSGWPPILGRVEGEYGPGGMGAMFKVGTGLDLFGSLRGF